MFQEALITHLIIQETGERKGLLREVCFIFDNGCLSVSQHVLDAAPVMFSDMLFNFFLGEPFEFGGAELCLGEVSLTSEDSALEEECLFAEEFGAWLIGFFGSSEVFDNVADGVVSDHPGVHVRAGGLEKTSLTRL